MERKIVALLNSQIQKEFESAYIYLGIASYFDGLGLDGFGSWFKKQASEEERHAMKFYRFLHERGEDVVFLPINVSKEKITDIGQALLIGLEHERYITSLIWRIYDEADDSGDFCKKNFLEWFIHEQSEEESKAKSMLELYNLFGKCPEGLYSLNKEFGARM